MGPGIESACASAATLAGAVGGAGAVLVASGDVLALVTGGAGFIGSNLVDALIARGDDVVAVDDLSTGRRENFAAASAAGARLVEADIRDAEAMAGLLEAERPDCVFHLAAQMDVRRSVEDPVRDLRTNSEGTVNMLEAARQAGASRFVNTSTGGAMYGEADVRPTPESHPIAADAPYGVSKLAAEGYTGVWSRLYGLSTISLRLGNVYGARQNPHGEAGVVAIFCGRALAGDRPTVYGDGLQTRDFIHVDDVVDAMLVAGASDASGAYNVGTGIESSVLDLVAAIAPHADGGFEPQHEPERRGEIKHSALDSTRAREELGWSARVGLDDGIARTVAWARGDARA
jgi:UDP-glucose 4-epimerase